MASMEPALDVISRALHGDDEARSFLERTTSEYVLDVSNTSNPKTYGGWNFVHQAMNEIERHEAAQNYTERRLLLTGQVRLLATMALQAARRSPLKDKALVGKCLSGAGATIVPSLVQWLVDLNLELREIVIGRIAAMAFDFSFHRMVGPNGHSAFADRVVMDTFCATLSANAVSSGPQAISHFASEWIIPSSRSLPTPAVAAVVFHLALEGMRKPAPAGTKETLQRLSRAIIVVVLVPALADAISENPSEAMAALSHEVQSRTAAMCLRALKEWCCATDLSLPQINHICRKGGINTVHIISDAMYSDSDDVVDALAEFIELTVPLVDSKVMSQGRMDQVRHLLQVDEETFRGRFTPEQLKTVESKEMGGIVEELVTAIGLQRFRFTDRQNKDEHGVCRNLARIAAAICTTYLEIQHSNDQLRQLEPGALSLLLRAASHPAVYVSAISMSPLTRYVMITPSLSLELLPTLQRRAIIPHQFVEGTISFAPSDSIGISMSEFLSFRENILKDTLLSCWAAHPSHYMESCTAAVEEFCDEYSSVEVSLQLEAALFCIEIVSSCPEAMNGKFTHSLELTRVINALSMKRRSMISNPLTSSRACRLLGKYSEWYTKEDKTSTASEICLSCLLQLISGSDCVSLNNDLFESACLPATEVAMSLKTFLCRSPTNFISDESIEVLKAAWEKVCASSKVKSQIPIGARLAFTFGFVHVLRSLPDAQRQLLFENLASSTLSRLERASNLLHTQQESEKSIDLMSSLSDEVRMLSGMFSAFTATHSYTSNYYTDGHDNGTSGNGVINVSVPAYSMALLRKVMPVVLYLSSQFSRNEQILLSLDSFLTDLLPLCAVCGNLALLKDLCSVVSSLLGATAQSAHHCEIAFRFIDALLNSVGTEVEKLSSAKLGGTVISDAGQELGRLVEMTVVESITASQENLGTWTRAREQGQGQPAFESRSPIAVERKANSNDALASAFSMLSTALKTCPTFTFFLPAALGVDREEDTLLRRAIDAAACSLNDGNTDLVKSCICFLVSLTSLSVAHNETIRTFAMESLSRIRYRIVEGLLFGICGAYNHTLIPEAGELMFATLRQTPLVDIESYLTSALQHDWFRLGDEARRATVLFMLNCAQQNGMVSHMSVVLERIWDIHQVNDSDSLPSSDAVQQLLRMQGASM